MLLPPFSKTYSTQFADPAEAAIKKYGMIPDGTRVSVGLSGGKDSAVLLLVLRYLQEYSQLKFELSGTHIKTYGEYDTGPLRDLCKNLNVPYYEGRLELTREAPRKSVCYVCARLKRGALKNLLAAYGITTVAYGHHADDAAETLLMNALTNRKLGTFAPKVGIPEAGSITIIRPLIYLSEDTIRDIHTRFGLPLLDTSCPYEPDNQRNKYKKALLQLGRTVGVKNPARRIVAAIENPDTANDWKLCKPKME